MTYSYDVGWRLATTVVDGRLDIPQDSCLPTAKRDGVADYVVRSVKLADGSRWVEIVDHVWTSPSATACRRVPPGTAGTSRPAARRPRFRGTRRRIASSSAPPPMMPLGWSNPLMTPLPLWTPSPLPD